MKKFKKTRQILANSKRWEYNKQRAKKDTGFE